MIAYAIRSRVWSDLATDTSQLDHIQNAIDDANMAEKLTPGNPFALTAGLIAYNRGIELKEFLGQDSSQWRASAASLAIGLDNWPKYVLGREERATFYHHSGQFDLETKEEMALVQQDAGGLSTTLAWRLEQNEVAALRKLVQSLERDDSPGAQIFRSFRAGGGFRCGAGDDAMRIFAELDLQAIPYPEASIALDIPLLCGRNDAAKQASLRLLKVERPATAWDWWQHRAAYLAGRVTERNSWTVPGRSR